MFNQHSLDRLDLVYPVLVDKIKELESKLSFGIIVAEGLRSGDYQHTLWLKGRNPDGSYLDPVHHKGVVTNADTGHSWHEYGLAVDCDVLNKDGSIDWNANHPQWKEMERAGIVLGLISGSNWGGEPIVRFVDAPHFQITGRFPVNAPDDEVRQILAEGGLQAVWDAIGGNLAA